MPKGIPFQPDPEQRIKLVQSIQEQNGNLLEVAAALSISYGVLQQRIDHYGLTDVVEAARGAVKEAARARYLDVLHRHGGNFEHMALELGIAGTSVGKWIGRYGLEEELRAVKLAFHAARRAQVKAALEENKGHVQNTAKQLGVSFHALHRWMVATACCPTRIVCERRTGSRARGGGWWMVSILRSGVISSKHSRSSKEASARRRRCSECPS